MRVVENFDRSWLPVITEMYNEPLKTLFQEELPNVSFQPRTKDIFKVFQMPVKDIKVVILGAEPSIIPQRSTGLSFAVSREESLTEELHLFREQILEDFITPERYTYEKESLSKEFLDIHSSEWRTLEHWHNQGVFMLNTALTVKTGELGSHKKAWEKFVIKVITFIAEHNPCVWLLLGEYSQSWSKYIYKNPVEINNYSRTTIGRLPAVEDRNYIITGKYPEFVGISDTKSDFIGSNCFWFIDRVLKKTKSTNIRW